MLTAYATVLVFVLVATAFVFGSLLASRFVRPPPSAEFQGAKRETYESAEEPVSTAWFNFNPRFYLLALVVLVFDVELAFVVPVAVVFRRWVVQGLALRAFVEIGVFVAVLLLGLAYAWRKGDLEGVRTRSGGAPPADVSPPVVRSRSGRADP